MKLHSVTFLLLSSLISLKAQGDPGLSELRHADLDRLLAEIKPQRGESPWREITWLTDVTEARKRAVAEDRPLVIFTAADGSPLGRT